MMHKPRKSDKVVVPAKSSNKESLDAQANSAEKVEGRTLTKGNSPKQNTYWIQGQGRVQSALERIRAKASADKEMKFTNLMHNIYSEEALFLAFQSLEKRASPGIDDVTWKSYGENLAENLRDLSDRLRRGGYRAKPVKRVFIPKADGRQRPLGVPVLEDKIVQKAMVVVLNAIYETDFVGFSYGYRPNKSQHHALDAVYSGILTNSVNWVLDGDISSFFDRLDHSWLMKFLEHRTADQRVLRLIQKWLNAGVMEGGKWSCSEEGTPQGGSVSPLLANIFLHYVFDLWSHSWRTKVATGNVVIVRYADDFVVGFEKKSDAMRFRQELEERLKKFGLELHPEKTRVIEFGYWAAHNRAKRGEGRPETFTFLGFTHRCAKKHGNGLFTIHRSTSKKKMSTKLLSLKIEMRRRMLIPVSDQGKWLRNVIHGIDRYYGVPGNESALNQYRHEIAWRWWRTLRRRGNRRKVTWNKMQLLIDTWFPKAQIHHPYPLQRMGIVNQTRGKSRMR